MRNIAEGSPVKNAQCYKQKFIFFVVLENEEWREQFIFISPSHRTKERKEEGQREEIPIRCSFA